MDCAREARDETARCLARMFGLSASEQGVLSFMLEGRSGPAISRLLGISPHTAKTHMHHIYQKMGVSGRSEMMALIWSASEEELQG